MPGEIHYLAFDPDKIWAEMMSTHIDNGGDVLYPGDEKEMLMRSVLHVITQVFAAVDGALRMDTLRFAARDYLDLYAEKRFCTRIPAQSAKSYVQITFRETGTARTFPAGTALTADGMRLYQLDEDVEQTGYAQMLTVSIHAQETGSAGNGLLAGTQMQFLVSAPAVESIICMADAFGGQEQEDDETYRARTQSYGLASSTTGSRMMYEKIAMSVSSEIIDARAMNMGAGIVGIYLLLNNDVGADAIIENVKAALSPINARPLTDSNEVLRAPSHGYTLNVMYKQAAEGSNIAAAVADAVAEYQKWQDEKLGRPFNPDMLIAKVYQAGAIRVTFGEGSHFNDGAVEYTEIKEYEHCSGKITITAM